MKRDTYKVTLSDPDANVVGSAVAYAHNSGVRKAEALVRDYARQIDEPMYGDMPVRDSAGYVRVWRTDSGDVELVASVEIDLQLALDIERTMG